MGKKVYLHCAGGHGRTGTVAAVVLHMLCMEMTETELFEYITKYKTIAYDLLEKFSVMIKPYCNKPFVELKYEEEKINCNYNFLFF